MNFKKIFLFTCLFILITHIGNSQSKSTTEIRIKTGQEVPDKILRLKNSNDPESKFSKYRGKTIILDFWATWCTACIQKFQYLDSIQDAYPDKVKILLVNIDEENQEELVEKFLIKYKSKHKDFSLPIVIGDTTLPKQFPFISVPHYAIINKDGIFESTSNGKDVTGEIIEKLYKNEKIVFHTKDDYVDFDISKPLFVGQNGGVERGVVQKSIITHYLPGIMPGSFNDIKAGKGTTLFYRNLSALHMYNISYNLNIPKSHIIFEVNDKERFFAPVDADSLFEKTYYCYELITSRKPEEKLFEIFRNDLNSYFDVKAGLEMRNVKCLVLKKDNTQKAMEEKRHGLKLSSLEGFVSELNAIGNIPVVTDIKDIQEKIITSSGNYQNKEILNNILKENGLVLIEEQRLIKVFVISDRK